MRGGGGRVASPPTRASRPKPSWERSWWSRCRRRASCQRAGWCATRGLGATRRCWTGWMPPGCGTWPKCRARPKCGRCASRPTAGGGRRWPMEWCFEEGKGGLGMDQYELRFWRGWYHHMTLVEAHHFLVRLHQRLMARSEPTPDAPAPAGREGDLQAPRDCGPPGRRPLATAGGAAPESAYRALLAAGYLATTRPRSARGLGAARLPAPAPGRRLPLSSQTPPHLSGSPWLMSPLKVSLSC